MGNSHLFIDSLEGRQLLAAVSGVPIFSGSITGKTPTFVVPGQSIIASLSIKNSGGDLSHASVPIGIYVSDDPTMDSDAEFVDIQNVSLNIHHNKSQKVSLKKFMIPTDIANGANYVLLQIDDNSNGMAIAQGDSSHTVAASTPMYNPVAEYDSTISGDTIDDLSLQVNIDYSDGAGKVSSYCTVDTANLGTVTVQFLKTSVSSTGKFSASGTYNPYSYGGSKIKKSAEKGSYKSSYNSGGGEVETITITGALKVENGELELMGTVKVAVKIPGDAADSGKASANFTATAD